MTTDPRDAREPLPRDDVRAADRHPDAAPPPGATGGRTDGTDGPDRLFPADRAADYGRRWEQVKGSFVDEPRHAVAQADALVGELLDDLGGLFREHRGRIEAGLDADSTSTEDLRLAVRRYRTFFDGLLSL